MKLEKNKKIIFLVSNDLCTDNRMHRIGNTLSKNNYNVELVGRHLPLSKPLPKLFFLPTRIRLFFTKGFLFYAELNIRFFFYLLFHRFDVVCACDADTLLAAFLASKIKRKKIVFDAHEYFSETPELVGRKWVRKFWQAIEKLIIPKVDEAYTVCDSLARIFKSEFNKPFQVIRNMPIKNSTVESAKTENYFLYQGSVNIGRGIKETILAIQYIDDYQFWIAGDGDEMEEIKRIITHYKLQNKVLLLGKMLPEELRKITHNAFAGINLLQHRGKNYYYSLGNKFFDYIQAHVPQVAIAFPEYIYYNNQYNVGVLVDSMKIENIVSAMKKLINDKAYYQTLKQNCVEASKQLHWEIEETKLLAIYNKL